MSNTIVVRYKVASKWVYIDFNSVILINYELNEKYNWAQPKIGYVYFNSLKKLK